MKELHVLTVLNVTFIMWIAYLTKTVKHSNFTEYKYDKNNIKMARYVESKI
jgi:hypothetical protein